jgi:hypothetical protein
MGKSDKAGGNSGAKVWAVGGGKRGVGKSTISIFLAFWLARMGKQTILMDVDLGGANLHNLLGIKSPPRTINDFITKRYNSLEDIYTNTEIENLRLISGEDVAESLRKEIEEIQPEMITNMVRNSRDKNAGRIIQLVAEKHLMVYCTKLGGVDYDRYVYAATSGMAASTRLDQSSNALACTYEIAVKLLS